MTPRDAAFERPWPVWEQWPLGEFDDGLRLRTLREIAISRMSAGVTRKFPTLGHAASAAPEVPPEIGPQMSATTASSRSGGLPALPRAPRATSGGLPALMRASDDSARSALPCMFYKFGHCRDGHRCARSHAGGHFVGPSFSQTSTTVALDYFERQLRVEMPVGASNT